jgi:hypothetical protein
MQFLFFSPRRSRDAQDFAKLTQGPNPFSCTGPTMNGSRQPSRMQLRRFNFTPMSDPLFTASSSSTIRNQLLEADGMAGKSFYIIAPFRCR